MLVWSLLGVCFLAGVFSLASLTVFTQCAGEVGGSRCLFRQYTYSETIPHMHLQRFLQATTREAGDSVYGEYLHVRPFQCVWLFLARAFGVQKSR